MFIRHYTIGGITSVTLLRPDLHNAFNEVVIAELTQAFQRVGADVYWMKKMVDYSAEENVTDAMAMAAMLRAIRECLKPIIARVHGPAIGGGGGLIAAGGRKPARAEARGSLHHIEKRSNLRKNGATCRSCLLPDLCATLDSNRGG